MDELEIKGTAFNKAELKRIIGLIPQTDPRTREYAQLLESIERFIYFANVVAAAQDLVERDEPKIVDNIVPFNPPVKEEEKFEEPEPGPEPETEATTITYDLATVAPTITYDLATVRTSIQDARMSGKIGSAKEWLLENFGVSGGLSSLPAAKYGAVMDKLKELG